MMIQSSGRVWRVRASPLVLALTLLFAGPEDFEGRGRPHGIPLAKALSEDAGVPLGFSPQTWFEVEQRLEQRYLKIPSPARCRRFLRRLTAEPHVAGTPGDRRVTQFIYDEFKRDGLNPEIVEYRVLLSYPKEVVVELVAPATQKLANPEPVIRGDRETGAADPLARIPWNGYSPSADLTRAVVYANYGAPEDYDRLDKLGVSVREKIALVRYFHGYRGGKGLEAEKRGAAGVIVYSDPAEDGASQGKTYPDGPWGPAGHFQRGAVVYDFLVPGDPLTPGWPSTDSARRLSEAESKILPKIPMVPLSAADAKEILSRLGGPQAPKEWQGGLNVAYHLGDGSTKVHLALRMQNRVTPIWDVIGRIRGSDEPEKLVVLSNHHDAWVYGAVDPSSGTASMLEVARAFGQLLRQGFRPRRTIVLGSWDAEEYTLTGSTEWGEQFEDELRKNGVVCLNVDAATSGPNFTLSAVPALVPAVIEAAEAVRDPGTGRSVYDAWRTRRTVADVRSYAVPGAAGAPVPFGVLGGGSDFMVFLEHNGVPSLDMIFDGPYGVYHSLYDDFNWMKRFGDPGFRYHAAMSRLWGLVALRFANADLVPLDYSIYATELAAYLDDLKKVAPADFSAAELQPLIEKCHTWHDAAARVRSRMDPTFGHRGVGEHLHGAPESGRAMKASCGASSRLSSSPLDGAPESGSAMKASCGASSRLSSSPLDGAPESGRAMKASCEASSRVSRSPLDGAPESGSAMKASCGASSRLSSSPLEGAPEGGRAMKALPYQGEGLHASEVNAALMAQERALLDTDGIPGRPWFRHLVYAPLPTYEAETLPGLREALVEKDMERAKAQAKEFGRALDRAIAALGRVQ